VVLLIPIITRVWIGRKDTEDFVPIYRAAQALWNHQDIYAATDGLYIYPPFLALLFQPLILLPEHAAAIFWAIVSALLILLATRLTAIEMDKAWSPSSSRHDLSLSWVITAFALLLSAEKIQADLRLGQTDCLILLGFALIIRWRCQRPWLTGLVVGATANMKYLSLIFLPYFIIKRNYRAAIASIVWFTFFMLLPTVEAGAREATQFALSAAKALLKMSDVTPHIPGEGAKIASIAWGRSVSITSAIVRVTRFDGIAEPIGLAIVLALLLLLLAVIVIICQRNGIPIFRSVPGGGPTQLRNSTASLEWATLIVFALVFSPQTTARHMVLMLSVYTLALALVLYHPSKKMRAILAISLILTAFGISFPPRNSDVSEALIVWRLMAGASLCAIFLLIVIVASGSRMLREIGEEKEKSGPGSFG
jgi:alpha-1,2-mannosyltransferase